MDAGPRVSPPKPPEGWAWPYEGDTIEVEVATDEDGPTVWCTAVVFAVLVDGWFAARIEMPDGSDSFEDWFTWQEEVSARESRRGN